MRNALIGGIIIGIFIKGWLGVFILPAFVALFQCIELFFLLKKQNKIFDGLGKEINEHFAFNNIRIFFAQFFWTYVTTSIIAIFIYFIKTVVLND